MNCTSVYQDDENEFVIIILQTKKHITAYILISSQFDRQRLP